LGGQWPVVVAVLLLLLVLVPLLELQHVDDQHVKEQLPAQEQQEAGQRQLPGWNQQEPFGPPLLTFAGP